MNKSNSFNKKETHFVSGLVNMQHTYQFMEIHFQAKRKDQQHVVNETFLMWYYDHTFLIYFSVWIQAKTS